MSLKITFVTETFPPEVNGVAMTVGRLVSGMRERGHRVSVIRPRQGKADAGGEHETAMPGLPLPGYPVQTLIKFLRILVAQVSDCIYA